MSSFVSYELEAERLTIPGIVYDCTVYVVYRKYNRVCSSVFAIIDITTNKAFAKKLVSSLRTATRHKTNLAAIQRTEKRITNQLTERFD